MLKCSTGSLVRALGQIRHAIVSGHAGKTATEFKEIAVVSIMDAVLCIAAASDSNWKQRRPYAGYKRPKSVSKKLRKLNKQKRKQKHK